MQMMTSAYANKVLKKLENDKEYYLKKESDGYVYRASLGEEPVVPEYDYEEISSKIAEIDEQILRIKHSVNVSNASNKVMVGENEMTIDMLLVRMAQLNNRRQMLDVMRKLQPKSRVNDTYYGSKNKPAPEYEYINFDLNRVQADYDVIDQEIAKMQLALDKYNQTVEFEVDM